MRDSESFVKESKGFDIWLWMEKTPPIVISPSLDNTGNSVLPNISQLALSSTAPQAPTKKTRSNIISTQSQIWYLPARIWHAHTNLSLSYSVTDQNMHLLSKAASKALYLSKWRGLRLSNQITSWWRQLIFAPLSLLLYLPLCSTTKRKIRKKHSWKSNSIIRTRSSKH